MTEAGRPTGVTEAGRPTRVTEAGRPTDPRVDPQRVAALPSAGRLAAIGGLATLVPGIVVYVVCRLAGMSTGPAGLVGLLAMIVGMGWYPMYLRRLGRRLDAQVTSGER